MNRILLFDGNDLEREIAGEILTSGLRSTETVLVGEVNEALDRLEDGTVDLFIVDIPSFDLTHRNLVASARELAPDTPILVTSVAKNREISSQIWRLGVQDYLLKPYRPAWLLAAVNVLARNSAVAAEDRASRKRKESLDQIMESIKSFKYKNCMEVTREYLDLLYSSGDNMELIRASAVAFAEELSKLGGAFGSTVQWKLKGCLERFRSRFDVQSRKHDTYAIFEEMLGLIFSEMEDRQCYPTDDAQKILNYIDRNIKKGISLDEAAEYVNMSSCYFSKFFKKMTGENFITYVTNQKIETAKQMLLDTDMPVINIAYELSYSETNYFSKAFKKKVGVTPTEFREQHFREEKIESAG